MGLSLCCSRPSINSISLEIPPLVAVVKKLQFHVHRDDYHGCVLHGLHRSRWWILALPKLHVLPNVVGVRFRRFSQKPSHANADRDDHGFGDHDHVLPPPLPFLPLDVGDHARCRCDYEKNRDVHSRHLQANRAVYCVPRGNGGPR